MVNICASNLHCYLSGKTILHNINVKIHPQKITAVIGPNGSGKSTLLKSLAGLMKGSTGEVIIDNQLIKSYSQKKLAQKLSFLPQNPDAPSDMTVKELVTLGRYSYQTWMGLKKEDYEQIEWAIRQVNLGEQINNSLSTLSGGQQQRAWIALSLAQDSRAILLDEPTSFLDIRHQLEILSLLRLLNEKAGKTIVLVLHDIQHVLQFADYLIIMDQGKMVYHDNIDTCMNTRLIEKVFGVKITLFKSASEKIMLAIDGLTNTLNQVNELTKHA